MKIMPRRESCQEEINDFSIEDPFGPTILWSVKFEGSGNLIGVLMKDINYCDDGFTIRNQNVGIYKRLGSDYNTQVNPGNGVCFYRCIHSFWPTDTRLSPF